MISFINRLLGRRASLNQLLIEKSQKQSQTEAYLRAHRKCARPQVPLGFTKRSSANYYLTSHHNHI